MDNLPTVIMEAMAAGLPVISTNIAGIPEMIQPGINGELVRPNGPNQLADAIESFIGDATRARKFGERGREIGAQKFSLSENVRELQKLTHGLDRA